VISRREFIGTSLAAGATLAVTPELLRAFEQAGGKLLQRAIPSSGEMLPVISFAPRPTATPAPGPIPAMPTDVPAARAVLKMFLDNGGRVVDVLHGGPVGEQAGRTAASELGIQDKFFWTTPVQVMTPAPPGSGGPPPKLDAAALKAQLEEKFKTFKVGKIDLVMAPAGADATHFAALREMKKEGRIRYIGVHELLFPPNAPSPAPATARLEAVMRNEEIDFIGTDYHVGDRRLEEKILPLALERKIGVLAYFAFDRGRLFKRVGTTPLPDWAGEFDARTWPQFFLKYVLSQPAVILARTGTTNPAHMLDNIGGGIGRLPDAAMRKRMAALVDGFPPNSPAGPAQPQAPQGPAVALSAAVLDRYVGEYSAASGFTATVRREGDKLIVKPGNNPEAPLIARSETRFQDPRGPFFEFLLDAQGKVTGAVLEQQGPQGAQKIPLERK
jgi:aryl-alcohol dehydrogenase-like predicted oxidoreductase